MVVRNARRSEICGYGSRCSNCKTIEWKIGKHNKDYGRNVQSAARTNAIPNSLFEKEMGLLGEPMSSTSTLQRAKEAVHEEDSHFAGKHKHYYAMARRIPPLTCRHTVEIQPTTGHREQEKSTTTTTTKPAKTK